MKITRSGAIFLAALMGTGCLKLFFGWNRKEIKFPEMNTKNTVCVFENGDALIGGFNENHDDPNGFEKSVAMIYRYSASTEEAEPVYRGANFVNRLACKGGVAYGILGKLKETGVDSYFFIIKSSDGGKTWTTQSEVHDSVAEKIVIVNEKEAWFLGPDLLIRTRDGGESYEKIFSFKMQRISEVENLGFYDNKLFLAGKHLRYTEDDGKSWKIIDSSASRYYAVDHGYVLGELNSVVTIGKIVQDQIHWIHSFEGDFEPIKLVAVNNTIRFIGTPNLDLKHRKLGILDAGDGNLLFESRDAGETWSRTKLDGRATGRTTDITGEKAGFCLGAISGVYTP